MLRWLTEVPSRWLHRLSAFLFLPVLALVVAADVFARYLANAPLQWAGDVSALTLLMLFAAALPICTLRNTHIRVETLYEMLGPRMRALADVLSHLSGAAFTGLLGYWEFKEVPGMIRRGEGTQMADIPHWPIALFVAVCAAIVFFILLVEAGKALVVVASGSASRTPAAPVEDGERR